LGAHIRIQGGRYLAGFAVVDADRLGRTESLSAPADRDEPGQLADLYLSAADLIREVEPEVIAIRASEAGSAAALRVAQHAEGAVMAATGSSGIRAVRFVTASLWKPAGFAGSAKAAQSIAALCAQLRNPPDGPNEVEQAAAAARAAIVKGP
jgi:Holliday junction resolvasome RuvABC endonuclease subunit